MRQLLLILALAGISLGADTTGTWSSAAGTRMDSLAAWTWGPAQPSGFTSDVVLVYDSTSGTNTNSTLGGALSVKSIRVNKYRGNFTQGGAKKITVSASDTGFYWAGTGTLTLGDSMVFSSSGAYVIENTGTMGLTGQKIVRTSGGLMRISKATGIGPSFLSAGFSGKFDTCALAIQQLYSQHIKINGGTIVNNNTTGITIYQPTSRIVLYATTGSSMIGTGKLVIQHSGNVIDTIQSTTININNVKIQAANAAAKTQVVLVGDTLAIGSSLDILSLNSLDTMRFVSNGVSISVRDTMRVGNSAGAACFFLAGTGLHTWGMWNGSAWNGTVSIDSLQSANIVCKGSWINGTNHTVVPGTSRVVFANAGKAGIISSNQPFYDVIDSATTGQIDSLPDSLAGHNLTIKTSKWKFGGNNVNLSGNLTWANTCSDTIFARTALHRWTFTGASPTLTLQGTGKRLLDSAQWVPQHSLYIVMDSNNTIRAFLPTLEAAAQTWIMQASRTLTSLVSTPYAWSGQGGVADTMRSSTPGAYARMGLSTAKPCSTLYLKDMAFQSYALTCTTGCYNGGNDSNVVWDTLKVSAITPTSISTAGGPCTLTVTHGRTAGGAVTVDGGAATLLSQGAAQWRFTAPAHAAGTVAVVATSGLGGTPGTATINLEYIARPGTLAVLTSPQVDTVGKAATNQAVTHSGGTPTLYRAPTLPDGIIINSLTGQIHGAPTIASAKAGYPVYASNIAGEDTCYDTLTVLASCSTPTIIRAATQSGWVNVAITPMVTGHTGATPDSIKCRTVLPSGITCSALGTISGTSAIQSAKTGYRIVGYACSDSSVVWDSLSVRAYPVLTTLKHPMGRVAYVDTIIGSYFGASGGAATLGGTAVTISRQTNDTLIWSVPSKARGTYDFIYTNSPSALTDTVSFRVLVPSITVTNP